MKTIENRDLNFGRRMLFIWVLLLFGTTNFAHSQGTVIANFGFERPTLSEGGYVEDPEADQSGINFSRPNSPRSQSTSGVLRPPTGFSSLAPRFGDQYARMSTGGGFRFSEWLTDGDYLLTFWVAPQADGFLDWTVYINPDDNGNPWFEQTTLEVGWYERQIEFSVTGAGNGDLHRFVFSSNPTILHDVYFDNISLVLIPEPETGILLIGGLTVLSFVARRRRNAGATAFTAAEQIQQSE